jgi:hypothetical protein
MNVKIISPPLDTTQLLEKCSSDHGMRIAANAIAKGSNPRPIMPVVVVVYDAWPTLLAARPPTLRVRAVGATIQLLKHAPTEAIAPVLLESQRVSKEKPDPRDEVGLMVRRSTTQQQECHFQKIASRDDAREGRSSSDGAAALLHYASICKVTVTSTRHGRVSSRTGFSTS